MCFGINILLSVFVVILATMLVLGKLKNAKESKVLKETEEQRLARQEEEKQKALLQKEWEDQKDGYN